MQVEIKNKHLVITLPLIDPPRSSKSGKTLLVASTGGFVKSTAKVAGSDVSVAVNATIQPE